MQSYDAWGRFRFRPAVIAAAALALCGCAIQDDVRSITYDYTDRGRLAAERRVSQDMQDSCYLSGAQYAELVGPPQIVSKAGPAGEEFQATQSFYCVGTQGGP